jgi:hypothetical protein
VVRLALFLAAMPATACMVIFIDGHGLLELLGPRLRPGVFLLVALSLCTLYLVLCEYRRATVIGFTLLLGFSLYLDEICDLVRPLFNIFPLTMPMWLLMALAPPLLAGVLLCRLQAPWALRFACLLLGGYIQAVHMHNAFNTWQHMGFFRGGWIS